MNDDADSVWKALADPTRRAILDFLRPGPMTTGELAEKFDQSRFNVMKHMGVLEHCGLLIVERRGRERWNYLNAARLREATNRWMTSFQLEWSNKLNDLGHALQGLASVPATRQLPTLHVEEMVTCPVSPERLYATLTRDLNSWWHPAYRHFGAGGMLSMQPQIGGQVIERSADGRAVIWGQIDEIKAPNLLLFSGRFGLPHTIVGQVEFRIDSMDDRASVLRLCHRAIGEFPAEFDARCRGAWQDLLHRHLLNHLAASPAVSPRENQTSA